MKYRDGYKYQLAEDEVIHTDIYPDISVREQFIKMSRHGTLTIQAGYAWDGPSGPTYDSANSLRASLVHDALYQLMRLKHLPKSYRAEADMVLEDILEQDGMWAMRRWYWLKGVQWFAGGAANPSSVKVIKTAP